jgi:radical SAM protein with 4Fe4S-binding SPASM domain
MTPLPKFLQIEPVGQCNLRCRMCAIQFRDDRPADGGPAHMPFETFRRLLDEFGALDELHLQGLGEPFMHPRFFDMVEEAVRRGIRVTTNTNMTLLSAAAAERCVRSGLHTLHMSIDGATAETYESIRTRARWPRVVANIERLIRTRRRLGRAHPRLHLVMVVMRRNLHELPALIDRARGWEVEEVFVQHLSHEFGEAVLPPQYRPLKLFVEDESLAGMPADRVETWFEEARRRAERAGIRLRLPRLAPRPHPAGTPGRARCDWPWRGSYISYQGLAMPCCMVSTPDRAQFGNMAEDGVEPVWRSPAYEAFRERLDSDDPPEICRSCSLYKGLF